MNNSYYRDSLTKRNHKRSVAKPVLPKIFTHEISFKCLRRCTTLFLTIVLCHAVPFLIKAHLGTYVLHEWLNSSHDYMLFRDSYFDVHFSVSYDFHILRHFISSTIFWSAVMNLNTTNRVYFWGFAKPYFPENFSAILGFLLLKLQ